MIKKKNEPKSQNYFFDDLVDKQDNEEHPTSKDIETADGLIDHIKKARPTFFPSKDTLMENVPLKRLCDYLALDIFPRGVDGTECVNIFERKIKSASYEEILATWKYIRSMIRKFPMYEFSQLLTVLSIYSRPDYEDILKRISKEPGFKRLNMPKIWNIIVQYLQNSFF